MATKRKTSAAAAKPRAAPKAARRKLDDAGIDWDRIRADYEIGARKVKEIADAHGIKFQKISARARRDGWPTRKEIRSTQYTATGAPLPVDAEALAGRLIKLIAREIADLEAQRKVTRDEALGERQARRLASLVRSADKLHEIEKAARQAKKNDPESDREKRRIEDERILTELRDRFARCFAAADAGAVREAADAARGAGAP